MVVPWAALLFLALVGVVLWAIYRALNPGYPKGRVFAVDAPPSVRGAGSHVGRVPRMHSPRYGLAGTPDELRTSDRGHWVPVEIKSSVGPTRGAPVYASHRIQLLAYCLLVEEQYGVSPPYGILIYRDGAPREVAWNGSARNEVIDWIGRARQPYRDEADPSPGKCARCPYRRQCDRAL